MTHQRLFRVGIGALVVIIVFALGAYLSLFRLGVLPRLGFAPGWALTDGSGERLTSEDLRGHIVVYSFFYARADDPRRDTGRVLQTLQEVLRVEDTGGVPVNLVTISFDARHDNPAALREAGRRYGADSTLWSFLTGGAEAIRRAVRDGFGVYYEEVGDGEFRYDPVILVVDGWGIVRSRYRLGLPPAEDLLRDVRSVVREVEASDGPMRFAYEAAHLFSCYSNV